MFRRIVPLSGLVVMSVQFNFPSALLEDRIMETKLSHFDIKRTLE